MKLSAFRYNAFPKIFKSKHRRSIELISPPGLGKSSIVMALRGDIAAMMGIDISEVGFVDLFLATQQPPDLVGLPFKGTIEYNGQTMPITDPTMPTWMVTQEGKPVFAYKYGILFLDEFGKGDPQTKAASAELVLNRRIGNWHLPDGWIVIAASNRASDRSGETKSHDFVINRRIQYNITPDIDELLKYGESAGWREETLAFAYANPDVVFEPAPEKQGPWCTPRSLEFADEILHQWTDANGRIELDDPALIETLCGTIGDPATAQFQATIRLRDSMPDYDDIVAKPTEVPTPERADAMMLVSFHLASRVSAKDIGPVIKYIDRMPKDFSVTFVKSVIKRDVTLIRHPDVTPWVSKNASLLTLLNSAA
jgi:hypothetical protein